MKQLLASATLPVQYAAATYASSQEAEVLTASPAELVAIVYRILAREIRAAEVASERGDRAAVSGHAQKGRQALQSLRQGLDFTNGGEIAQHLEQVYSFLFDALVRADVRGEATPLRGTTEVVASLESAWQELARREKA